MATWAEFESASPEVARRGRELLYRTGSGEALLATARDDSPPRIHPIAVEVIDGGLYAFILRSPKLTDLEQNGRYALHAYPDANAPHEFQVRGHVRSLDDTTRTKLASRWPFTVGDAAGFEFLIDDAVYGERASRDDWPPKYTLWKSGR